jgi:hypothetical protein
MSGQDLKAVLGKNIKFLRFRRQFSQAERMALHSGDLMRRQGGLYGEKLESWRVI